MKTALLLTALLIASPAYAIGFIQRDLYAPGDGLIVYDPASGLEWLKLGATGEQSYDEVDAGPLHDLGFVHASSDDVLRLFGNVIGSDRFNLNFPTLPEELSDPRIQNADGLLGALGASDQSSIGYSRWIIHGVVSDTPTNPDLTMYHFRMKWWFTWEDELKIDEFGNETPPYFADLTPDHPSEPYWGIGPAPQFLYRHIPEGGPGLAMLALIGASGAIARRRR